MYYEEQMIGGEFYWRDEPDGIWRSFSKAKLADIIFDLRDQLKKTKEAKMDKKELELAYKKFKESFSEEDFAAVSPEMFFEYGYQAGQSAIRKEMGIYKDAMEDILYDDTISSKINCIVLNAKDEIAKLKENM